MSAAHGYCPGRLRWVNTKAQGCMHLSVQLALSSTFSHLTRLHTHTLHANEVQSLWLHSFCLQVMSIVYSQQDSMQTQVAIEKPLEQPPPHPPTVPRVLLTPQAR